MHTETTWKIQFANFLDDLRRGDIIITKKPALFQNEKKLSALLASSIEAICYERGLPFPAWTQQVPALDKPWFVSGMESLKACALVESPVFFRHRNIFVLNNFLSRA